MLVNSAGIEPAFPRSEHGVLSIELRIQSMRKYLSLILNHAINYPHHYKFLHDVI